MTQTHHEQQNLQLNICSKNSLGAWTCNHSNHSHFAANANRNAADNATTATQQTNSITVTIPKSKLIIHQQYIAIPGGHTGCPNPRPLYGPVHNQCCKENYGISIPFSMRTLNGQTPMFPRVWFSSECHAILNAFAICGPCRNYTNANNCMIICKLFYT